MMTFDWHCRARGLPMPVAEYRFAPPRRWRFDHAWPDRKVALEIDGGVWVRGRHSGGVGQVRDMEKLNEAAILGWRVLRVTPQQVESGHAADLIARIFTERRSL